MDEVPLLMDEVPHGGGEKLCVVGQGPLAGAGE